jgi:acetyl-CoA carboxylase carboxyl transferase subunit alpha
MTLKERGKKTTGTVERQREIDRLEKDVEQLRHLASGEEADAEVERIRRQVAELRQEFYEHLGPWQRAQIARHAQRPYTQDFIGLLFTDFVEIHGDRGYGDDKAIVAGLARFHGRPVAVIGHQKGRDTKQRLVRNFGQPKPEGYRKALRVMELAAKFGRPIFTFVDTQGAYPGIDAEERGQAEAIARNLREMARLPVPVIVTVTGEGGSGGALAIAVGDRVNILENSFYSVISPEGCAAIMWRRDRPGTGRWRAYRLRSDRTFARQSSRSATGGPNQPAHKRLARRTLPEIPQYGTVFRSRQLI